MIKNTIICCSCFIDKAVWFVNSSECSKQLWRFDCCVGGMSDEIFIYKKNPSIELQTESVVFKNEIIICCVKCFEFQLTYLSFQEKMVDAFNEINCRYVAIDSLCYDTDIYVGNDQFMIQNSLLTPIEREELYHETKKKLKKFFKKKPERKSCFTSLQKFRYECFCNECKNIFDKFF